MKNLVKIVLFISIFLNISLTITFLINSKTIDNTDTDNNNSYEYKNVAENQLNIDGYKLITFDKNQSESSNYGVLLKSGDDYFPLLDPKNHPNFKGMFVIHSDNVYIEEEYLVLTRKKDTVRGIIDDIWVIELIFDGNSYIGSLLTIQQHNPKDSPFILSNYLARTANDRCDNLYENIDFKNYKLSEIENLILSGCLESSFDPHNGPSRLTFAGGYHINLDENQSSWFENVISECGETCRYSIKAIE